MSLCEVTTLILECIGITEYKSNGHKSTLLEQETVSYVHGIREMRHICISLIFVLVTGHTCINEIVNETWQSEDVAL